MRLIYRTRQLILLTGDLLGMYVGLWAALAIRNFAIPEHDVFTAHMPIFSALFFIWIITNFISGLYDLEKVTATLHSYRLFGETTVVSFMIGVIFFYVVPTTDITPKTVLILTVLIGYGIGLCWRLIYIHTIGKNALQTKILFIGYTKETKELVDMMKHHPEKSYSCVAIIDPEKHILSKDIDGVEVYHSIKTIRPAISTHKARLAVIAPHLRQNPEALRELYELLFWKIQITDLSSFYQIITGRIPPSTFSEGWFLDHLKNKQQPVYSATKALVDYLSSIVLNIIFLAVLPFIAGLIKLTSPGPIFIKQKRIGKNGKPFTLFKFRSMYSLSPDGSAEIDGVQFAKKNDKRITKIGKILRKTRLDELPQAINLIKGDVTLVGPRPERPEIVEQLEAKMPYYGLRHIIKPGLTGWAVVNQHYTDTLETSLQKLQYDLFYIKNKSLLLDISILLRTVNVVIRLKGQ